MRRSRFLLSSNTVSTTPSRTTLMPPVLAQVFSKMGGHSVSSSSEDTAFVRSTSRILSDTMKWSFSIPFTSFSIRSARAFQNPTNGASFRHAHGERAVRWITLKPTLRSITRALRSWATRKWAKQLFGLQLRTSALLLPFRLNPAALEPLCGDASQERPSKKWSPDFPIGYAEMLGSLSSRKMISPSISTCCSRASPQGRFMCTVPPTIPGQIQEVNISQPIMPARSTSCSAKRHWNPPSSRKSASPLSNRM